MIDDAIMSHAIILLITHTLKFSSSHSNSVLTETCITVPQLVRTQRICFR